MAIRQGQDTIDPAATLPEPGEGDSGIRRPVPRGYPTSNSLWPGTTVRKGNKNTRKTARLTAGKTAGRHKGPDIRARNTKNRTRHAYFQAAGRIVRLFLLSLLG